MPRRKTVFELDHESDQLSALRATVPRIEVDPEFKKSINFKITVGNHAWLVHSERIVERSGFFKMMLKSDFKEATEHVVNLGEDEPELIARIIMSCYFGEYPTSPNSEPNFGALTVSQVMKNNMIDATKPFDEPLEPQFDAVLHLEMYVVAEKLDMKELMKYAKWMCGKALKYEPQGFWPVLEMLQEIVPEHLVERLEWYLAQIVLSNVEIQCILRKTKFEKVENAYPGLAAKLAELVNRARSYYAECLQRYLKVGPYADGKEGGKAG